MIAKNRQCSPAIINYPYHIRQVRDLAWSCFSPPLLRVAADRRAAGVSDCAPQLTPARRAWLEALDRDASALLRHLAARPTGRLGLYFEQLWHFFLAQDPQTQLLAHNYPVQEQGRTLGEFDCLYYCRRRGRHVHLELAVKYYLGVAADDGALWFGPNTRDRLDLKLGHLLDRQIRLAERPAARRRLQALGIDEPLREIALRGCLFQPAAGDLPLPAGYDQACPTGHWLPIGQLADYAGERDWTAYLPLVRLRWLSAARADADETLPPAALLEHLRGRFARGDGPQLVAALDAAGDEGERFFVTPDGWPHGARGD